jgi:hypothetical protein
MYCGSVNISQYVAALVQFVACVCCCPAFGLLLLLVLAAAAPAGIMQPCKQLSTKATSR